jgi:hypothetical protein
LGHFAGEPVFIETPGSTEILAAIEQVVNFDANSQLPKRPFTKLAIGGENERERFGEMRGDAVQNGFLYTGFADEANPALGKIADAAMEQPAGTAACAKRKIVLIHQSGAESAQSCVAGNSRAYDAAPDDEHIEPIGTGEGAQFFAA